MTKQVPETLLDGASILRPRSWKDTLLVIIGTCFGLGYSPWAPGTVSALWGVVIYFAIVWLAPVFLHTWLIAVSLVFFCGLTIIMAPWAERYWKRRDPNVFVTDEVAGFLMTVLLFRTPDVILTALWCFVVTRICDISKPWPARRLEELPEGWGILADDLCTSVYAAFLLYMIQAVWPGVVGAPIQR